MTSLILLWSIKLLIPYQCFALIFGVCLLMLKNCNYFGIIKGQLDVIAISETKEQSEGFLKNVSLDGYIIHFQHSNSSAGGVALYLRNNLDYIVREDLNALENEFETIWVEIKNKKSQNVLCCCAYRHPNTEVEKFNIT